MKCNRNLTTMITKKGGIMHHLSTLITTFLPSAILFMQISAQGQVAEENSDKTLSPYFFVKSDDPTTDQLPLKSTSADVTISGVIADVKVIQIYKNEGKNTLEAIYIFPASTRAAVYNMIMTIGERTITAKIKEREKARQEYEQARQEGKSASLLEQQRPNVFQMNVANILPGDEIKVELFYTELLVPTDKIYEFVYPTVVGPRYSNKPEARTEANSRWVKNPYLHEGEASPFKFDITVSLAAGMPIKEITCPSHQVNINYEGKTTALVNLSPQVKDGGNRDFILHYRLAGDQIESGLLLYEGEKEKFFLLMMQPPVRVRPNDLPPREYIFILDVSGSMNGFPLDISKKLFKDLINNLTVNDKFNLLLFAGGSRVFSEQSVQANQANITRAIQVIDNEQGGGGTELLPALQRALALPGDEHMARTVLILTDGYVDVEKEAFDLIRKNLGRANFFAFGIGSSVNRFLIEGIAKVGMAESFVVTQQDQAEEMAEKFRKYVQSPVLSKIKINYAGFDTYDVEPLSIPDVLAERPVIIYGKYNGMARGKIELKGIAGGGKFYSAELEVSSSMPNTNYQALQYLWARQRLSLLADFNRLEQNEELKNEITRLGLTYNLLTDYTSFIAVDERVRNIDGKVTRVEQPLPLPQGVSDYAVGEMAAGRGFGAVYSPSPSFTRFDKSKKVEFESLPIQAADTVRITIVGVNTSDTTWNGAIISYLENQFTAIKKCYAKNMSNIKTHKSSAQVTVQFTIKKDGQPDNIMVVRDELASKKLETCLVKTIKGWRIITGSNQVQISVVCTLQFDN
jgi:Ca-activated chloride channel family protein